MIGPRQWKRKGEWLETTAGQALQLPGRLQRKLEASGGIQQAGDRLRVRLFPEETNTTPAYWFELDVLYEDDFCLVINKPAGMLVHPTAPQHQKTLANAVTSYYECTGQHHLVRHIHRLDEYTSGPVLYAKNEFAHLRLDEQMRSKTIERIYIAFVQGQVSPALHRIDAPIGRDRHHSNRRRVSPNGDHAITHVEVLESYKRASLVRLQLETGRTHQIRVHLSHAGHPLIGDALYGGSTALMSYQALHGERLLFTHPLYGEMVEVQAPWPETLRMLQAKLEMES